MNTSTIATPSQPIVSASDYILSLFYPDDLIAIMTMQNGQSPKHCFAKAKEVASSGFMESLRKQNDAGCNIYVCMNPLTAKRRVKKNVDCIRTLYIDIDKNGGGALEKISQSKLIPKPHFVIQSSPNKFQVIWVVAGIQPEEQERVLDALIQEFGGDTAASDRTRVLRLPGFINHKYDTKPVIEIIEANFDGDDYTAADFKVKVYPIRQNAAPIPETIPETERNKTLTSLAGSMRRRRASRDAILAALRATNQQQCKPPLDDAELVTIADSISKYEPAAAPQPKKTAENVTTNSRTRTLTLVRGDQVKMRKVEWLWKGRLVADGLNGFSGEPGVGKSTVAANIMAAITRGRNFPDGTVNENGPKDVLIICDEEGREDVIVPRLTLAGADLTHVWFQDIEIHKGQTVEQAGTRLDGDLPLIEEKLQEHPEIVLIVPDPVTEYFGDANPNLDQEVGPIYTKMLQVSKRHHVAWLLISHFNKDRQATSTNRNSGAKVMVTKPRCNWLFTSDPNSADGRYLMLQGKCNLAKRQALAYYIETQNVEIANYDQPLILEDITRIRWDGETSDQADDVLLSMSDPKDRADTKVKAFLDDLLAEGPKRATECYELGQTQRINPDMLKRYGRGISKTQIQASDGRNEWWWAKTKLELNELRKQLVSDRPVEIKSPDDGVLAFLDGMIGEATMPVSILKLAARARGLNWEAVRKAHQRHGYESITTEDGRCWHKIPSILPVDNNPVPIEGEDANVF